MVVFKPCRFFMVTSRFLWNLEVNNFVSVDFQTQISIWLLISINFCTRIINKKGGGGGGGGGVRKCNSAKYSSSPRHSFLCKTQYLSFQNSDFGDISQHRNRKIILTFFFRVILPLSRMAYLHNCFDDISVNANLISIRFKSKRQRINTIIYCVNTLPLWFKSYSVFTYYRLCLSFPGPQARFSWIFLVY